MVLHKSHQYDPIATGVEGLSIYTKRFDRSAPARDIPIPVKPMDLSHHSNLNTSELVRCPSKTSQLIQSNI